MNQLSLSGSPADFFLAFLGGVFLSVTPCVYPLIPVSAGYIGARSGGSKGKGFFLSLLYVSGVAVTYSLLGLVASLTGQFFGAFSANPWVQIASGAIIVIFGLSMFELFTIPLPRMIKLPAHKKQDYLSTFLLGLSSGLMVSPCVTPVLGTILTYLATKKNVVYGSLLLFSFAYGMGLILIAIGTFSGLLTSLPKSGRWLVYIKKAWAVVLTAAGVYFIITAIGRLRS
ncbi:MAG TPA: cytochrome c biogenesis protein CcdA [Patescibacteria group bacterium]|nr:cytochrome c biogenesis protein CcdA [Patescibacteria group bacterium]